MPSLIVPSNVAAQRRAQLAAVPRGKGLGKSEHIVDPRDKIFAQVGMKQVGGKWVIPGFKLHGNRVLVGIYERPDKLASGIFIPDKTRQEDEHQSKAGLILMLGHSAFKSDDRFDFGPDTVEVGDWITLWVTDGRKIIVNGGLCRVVRDQDINLRIPTPDAVY
jgi:co-chaperonin GroES (HSP10)